jgi:DNA-binding transcriptional regulator YdaS (Cro superfamily)
MHEDLKTRLASKATQISIAEFCGVSQQSVSQWVSGNKVPAKRAIQVHKLTGIPLHELNPDVFPKQIDPAV